MVEQVEVEVEKVGVIAADLAYPPCNRAVAFEQYDLLFLEEPVLQEAIEAYRTLVRGKRPAFRCEHAWCTHKIRKRQVHYQSLD